MPIRLLALLALTALGAAACGDEPAAGPALDPAFLASGPVPDCGFEGGAACPIIGSGPRCDRGLDVDTRGTPANLSDDICVNDWRHRVGRDFRGTWADWALANQRTLAIDEPYSWTMHLVTHNANNNWADGRLGDVFVGDPNQVWSLSDQLDLGSRGLWIDLHWLAGDVRLCHGLGGPLHLGCTSDDRPFAYAAREIADWLARNPGEIVFLGLERYLEGHDAEVVTTLNTFFGDEIYRSVDADRQTNPWPSRRELLTAGKQVIIGLSGSHQFGTLVHRDYQPVTGGISDIDKMRVDRTDGIATECRTVADIPVNDEGDPILSSSLVRYTDHQRFRLVGEDRTLGSQGKYGYTTASDVADQAACNIKFISLDMIGGARHTGAWAFGPLPAQDRQPYAVWSWREGDRGEGDAALLEGADGRWRSANESEHHRFACGRPRSETMRVPGHWPDRLGQEWRITTRTGPWREGGRACLEEFGAEGFVFSVPVNGFMNGQLRLTDESRGDLWLNYDSMEAGWRINRRPLASAGADLTVECAGHEGTPVQLDAGQSADPDQHSLTYEWQGPFGTATGPNPTVVLPLGQHEIVLLVDDGFGGAAMDTVVVHVADTTAPEIHSAVATPDTLWAPNHTMVPVAVEMDVTDACDANPTCRIVSVSSDEVANGKGDGNTAPDWTITGALTLELRAERAGPGDGRVYTIVIECTDASGNVASRQVFVTVPHDRR